MPSYRKSLKQLTHEQAQKYCAAITTEIKVLGAQHVQGLDDNGRALDLNFQVLDKLSKPLASAWDIIHKTIGLFSMSRCRTPRTKGPAGGQH